MANPLYFPVFRAFDNDGAPLAGGKVYFYEAGTSTPKDTYTNSGAGTPNTNPVILDAYGSAPIWLVGTYKINLTDANDVQQNDYPIDNVTNDAGATGPAGTFPIATAGGTVDAITADYTPNVTLSNLTTVAFVASGANTVTNPTFSPDGLTARTITKNGGAALAIGDIPAAGFVAILEYNSANTRWEMANPATKETPWVVATGTANAITATYSPAIAALVDGLILSFRAAAANTTTTPTFSPNGLTARTITKKGGSALVAGDIGGNLAEYWVRYNLANTRWELLNPTGVSGIVDLTTATIDTAADYVVFHDATDGALKKALANTIAASTATTTTTASSSATVTFGSLDFTTNVGYDVFFNNVKPATDGANLLIRLTDDGSTYDDMTSGGVIGMDGGGATAAYLRYLTTSQGNDTTEFAEGICRITQPLTTGNAFVEFQTHAKNTAGTNISWAGNNFYSYSAIVTGIRFIYSSGNIATGTFVLKPIPR